MSPQAAYSRSNVNSNKSILKVLIMKKLLALIIALIMILSVFAACGTASSDEASDTSSDTSSNTESDSSSDTSSEDSSSEDSSSEDSSSEDSSSEDSSSEDSSSEDSSSDEDSSDEDSSDDTSSEDASSDDASSDDASSDDVTSDVVKEKVLIYKKNEASEYRIIFHNSASKLVRSKCTGLEYQAEQKFRIEIELVWLFDKVEHTDITDYEILIGDTTREESIAASQELLGNAENEFAIKLFDNGKIAIVASNDESLQTAIDYFTSTFITENSTDELTLEQGYTYYEKLPDTPKTVWSFSDIPAYESGVLAKATYDIGPNYSLSGSSSGKMQIITETSAEEFNAYLELLKTEGFTEHVKTENNGNIYVQFKRPKGNTVVYVYFHEAFSEVRVIDDRASRPEETFEYECEDGPITYYQYGMMHDPRGAGGGNTSFGKYGNNGAFDIIKLADNKLILIDGGGDYQVTTESTDAMINFLYEITGLDREAGDKITVALWYHTHAHGDHYQFMKKITETPAFLDCFVFERVMHNIAASGVMACGSDLPKISSKLKSTFPGIKYIKIHTGQNIKLGNVTIDVLMTHEDAVDPITGKSIIVDNNNVCPVLRITANNTSILYFGDWGGNDQSTAAKRNEYSFMENRLMSVNKVLVEIDGVSQSTYPMLDVDIVQTAHHAINSWMGNVYTKTSPMYAFFTQADVPYDMLYHDCYRTIIKYLHSVGTPYENMYFAGKQTHWLVIDTDGTITHDSKKFEGADEASYYYYTTQDGELLYQNNSGNITTDPNAYRAKLFTDLKGDRTSLGEFENVIAVPVSYWELCEQVDGGKTWLDGIENIK